jgi:putative flippase GtrA
LGAGPVLAKIVAESLLFAVNFVLMRDFVFTGRMQVDARRRERSHSSVQFAVRRTRDYTAGVLVAALRKLRSDDAGQFEHEP